LKEKESKKDEKRGFFDNVADGITIFVKEIHITVMTLGPIKTEETNPLTPPLLLMDITNMRLQATNQFWEVCVSLRICSAAWLIRDLLRYQRSLI